mmetsp:Transcript_57425/g.128203  ORF Transcript_57425/g.128203 Transcript_57425/m.128203 type:complete len:393 (-) Transcript_57425:510-1688(-)
MHHAARRATAHRSRKHGPNDMAQRHPSTCRPGSEMGLAIHAPLRPETQDSCEPPPTPPTSNEACLEEDGKGVVLAVLLDKHLEVLVNRGHREQDARARADGAHEIGDDGEGADTHATEGRGGGDVPVELLRKGRVAVALHHHLLVAQLLGHVFCARARNLDPRLREERASDKDKHEVEDGVEGVLEDLRDRHWGREVVDETARWHGARGTHGLLVLPLAKHVDEEVVGVALVEQLREEVEVGDERRLQDDWHVGRVEELDRVGALHAALRAVLDRKVDAEALEVDDDKEDEDGGHDVCQVGQILPVEGLFESAPLVWSREQQVEESDESTLELGTATGVDGGGRERLPDNRLADVGRDEQGDTRSEAVAFLEKLIQDDDNDASDEELQDDQD